MQFETYRVLCVVCAALLFLAWGCADNDSRPLPPLEWDESTSSSASGVGSENSADDVSEFEAVGGLGGACYPNATCNEGLECVDDVCRIEGAAEGALGGPCGAEDACEVDLECRNALCQQPRTNATESGSTGRGGGGPPAQSQFVLIPAGTFTMGSPEEEVGRFVREDQVSVTLTRSFYLQATPVTQGEYTTLMGENPSSFDDCGLDCPVERVSWFDAVAYANALSVSVGLTACYDASGEVVGGETVYDCEGYRLPTEAEWEHAARAGTATATYRGSLSGLVNTCINPPAQANLDPIAWWCGNSDTGSGRMTHPVGQKEPNAWGLYDMLGNVLEWTDTWYWAATSGGTDPEGPSTGSVRVLRGGSWRGDASHVRAARRYGRSPGGRGINDVGFRLARSAP